MLSSGQSPNRALLDFILEGEESKYKIFYYPSIIFYTYNIHTTGARNLCKKLFVTLKM